MITRISQLSLPLMRLLPPEFAHEAALRALELGAYPHQKGRDDPILASDCFGFSLPNPISIAAGFDKDARVAHAVLALGCGFAEVGTLTPRAQPGNPKPRIFRLPHQRALINRLGFNNGGHAPALARLQARKPQFGDAIVGVNIGANKDARDRTADYVSGLQTFYDIAAYFTVNISSPNTPGLRDLQAPDALDELLGRLMEARAELVARGGVTRPVIVKLAPDIAEDDIEPIVARLVAHNVDGIAVSNTTLARPGIKGSAASETGGLSGRPLFHRSTVMLARVHQASNGKIPLIGIGGVDSGARAFEKIAAGASLIQLYTGLIYEGVGLIARIKSELAQACRDANVTNYQQLVGRHAQAWAEEPIEG